MYPRYYASRRLNPFRGVVQTVEVEEAQADSFDGVTWHLRADDGFGWVRPVGVWEEGVGLRAGVGTRYPELIEALERRPSLPFPLVDSVELWLLDREHAMPLAQIDAVPPSRYAPTRVEAAWLPFVKRYTGYRSPALARHDALGRGALADHKETLARLVNDIARPHARAQWFRRTPEGGGEGLDGVRLDGELNGRRLDVEAFPELIVRETGNNQLEQSAISDYHAWVSPFLLLLPNLSDATRDRLEEQARARSSWLARVHRLLPKVADPERVNGILVAARLEAASGDPEQDL
jgi:hypothetical protein